MTDKSQPTILITASNLPTGNFWEDDGSCWQYSTDFPDARGYRLRPMNVRAFEKGEPTGPMYDFYPVSRT